MSKVSTFITIALLLCFVLSYATARPDPSLSVNSLPKTQLQEEVGEEVSCEGIGKEECLTRRTLAAHVDYIYTQNHKP
ncbi:Phytosulfokines 3-like protein [Melia azedarach]|uniref:Phytosulfokines 3-like protein n=1 Tax=Melia azedarach TaxID=155640 RepID=A0ACC1WR42_MELAZ|nr:Phytosulfokines 3-like protein [Melia azedarach]